MENKNIELAGIKISDIKDITEVLTALAIIESKLENAEGQLKQDIELLVKVLKEKVETEKTINEKLDKAIATAVEKNTDSFSIVKNNIYFFLFMFLFMLVIGFLFGYKISSKETYIEGVYVEPDKIVIDKNAWERDNKGKLIIDEDENFFIIPLK